MTRGSRPRNGPDGIIVNIYDVLLGSRANGPGRRAVVWFQGCSRHCSGCFNPETWPAGPRRRVAVEVVVRELSADGALDGLTLSGGEPLEQAPALLALVQSWRQAVAGFGRRPSVLLFTGYTLAQVRRLPLGPAILAGVDVVVAGPYRQNRHVGRGLIGSANQSVHLLSDRHQRDELANAPAAEVIIDARGTVRISGIFPPRAFEPGSGLAGWESGGTSGALESGPPNHANRRDRCGRRPASAAAVNGLDRQ